MARMRLRPLQITPQSQIGMVQEGRAEKAAEAIKAMLSSRATVVRGGERLAIEADQLVPGECVLPGRGSVAAEAFKALR